MNNKYFVTTPIYYISGKPHIGHLYTTAAADILSRYNKMLGKTTLFTTGSDENSQKVVNAAENAGMEIRQFVDSEAKKWTEYFSTFNIEFDRFIRTTDKDHLSVVENVVSKIYDLGYIYKGNYEGWYCVDCESFWTDKEVEEGLCPECKRKITRISEENYFFKLSAFQDLLLDFYKKNPKAIEPISRYNEVVSMIQQGLHDVSISRKSQDWGLTFPFDKNHAIWVWFDALINYLTVSGYLFDKEKFEKLWPADCHLMSKDIIRFHCVIWPAMLMALGLEPAKKVFVHGWWLTDGEKMSKSKGNVVNPKEVVVELSQKTGIDESLAADIVRWFLFRETSFGEDAVFSMERLLDRYNFDLANDLGNLINRVSVMTYKFFKGFIPEGNYISGEVELFVNEQVKTFNESMENYRFKDAIEATWNVVRRCNKLIEEYKPWELEKKEETQKLKDLIFTLLDEIRLIALMIKPFMPVFSEIIIKGFNQEINNDFAIRKLNPGELIQFPKVIFPRVKKEKKIQKEAEKKSVKEEKEIEYCSIDDFTKFDFRVAEILEAKKHPDADKLIVLQVQVGTKTKQIVAGIAKYYSPEELVGKKVVIVNNLKPVVLRGEKSEGMVMCASHKKKLCVTSPEDLDMTCGAKVK
jgi:methionyl-tRNA synthetase